MVCGAKCGYILAYDAMLYEVAVPCFMQCDAMLNTMGLDLGGLVVVGFAFRDFFSGAEV